MWGALGRLWLAHLAIVHEKKTKPFNSPVTLQSLKDQVRLIHALQPATLPCHSHYFHEDIEGVLHKATIQSLRTYIEHYLPCITRSIHLRRSRFNDSQFPHLPSQLETLDTPPPQEIYGQPPATTTHSLSHHTKHHAQEEPTHRRHSRNRIADPCDG